MSLLGGQVQGFFGELMGPLYLPAKVFQGELTYDNQGDLTQDGPNRDCLVQVDKCTEDMRNSEGYTSTDRAIFVLSSSLTGELDTDCVIEVREGDYADDCYRVAAPITRDPAAGYWLCRGVAENHG